MTAKEVAEHLRLNERTVLRLAQNGKIPAAKIARRWRFQRSTVNQWLETQMHGMRTEELNGLIEHGPLTILDTLRPELISLELSAENKSDVLKELGGLLVRQNELDSPDQFLISLLRREEMMTTAIGDGIAIPHPRQPETTLPRKALTVVGRSSQGVDFGSLDGQPTHLFFLLCAPSDKIHLQLMARLTRLLRSNKCVRALLAATDPESVINIISSEEESLIGNPSSVTSL